MLHTIKQRRAHSTEYKAKIVIAGLSKQCSVSELCRRNNIAVSLYYNWRKKFVLAGTFGLAKKVRLKLKNRTPINNSSTSRTVELNAIKKQYLEQRKRLAFLSTRMSASEKMVIIDLVQSSKISDRAILKNLDVARASYYRWVKKFREVGTLENCIRQPDYSIVTQREDYKELIFKILHSPPANFGFNRATWKANELQEAIAQQGVNIGRHSIRIIIKEAGYRWMKARKVLTSNDPEYRQKLADIQKILGSLTKREGFFSIDEYGPFAVKHRQGKKLIPPNATFTIPQFQKSKGKLIMTAALELSSNQVTHFYSKKKNTEEMIKLLEILKIKYAHLDRIFLSWDAASWHISKKLVEKIELENSKPVISRGPIVERAPLPAGAQFLNVIEAVFSGMSRAIIHNSNYSIKEQAMAAIDRYFLERNEYFQKYPKRAGNKIWGKEPSSVSFSESNNCKDPRYR